MRFALFALILAAGGLAAHGAHGSDRMALAEAAREARAAEGRALRLLKAAQDARSAAVRAAAEREALVSRVMAAEAGLTAASGRLAIAERLHSARQARLAQGEQPVVELVAALQTMTRRPAVLALAQPGSVEETARVRTLLDAVLPEIRRRTAGLRSELEKSAAIRDQARKARFDLAASRDSLARRRIALAGLEARQRSRSAELEGLSLDQSDRALALGEAARILRAEAGTQAEQAALATRLAALPGPLPRPNAAEEPASARPFAYRIPVEGRLLTGVGEISDGGVHSRGLTLAVPAGVVVDAPAAGRVAYAAPFGSYRQVVILDHGGGWSTVLTGLAGIVVRPGQAVAAGAPLGRTSADPVTVELRHQTRPVPFVHWVSG